MRYVKHYEIQLAYVFTPPYELLDGRSPFLGSFIDRFWVNVGEANNLEEAKKKAMEMLEPGQNTTIFIEGYKVTTTPDIEKEVGE